MYGTKAQIACLPQVLTSHKLAGRLALNFPGMQFDMTFPALPCEWISLDVMDISGDMHLDVVRMLLVELLMQVLLLRMAMQPSVHRASQPSVA